MTAGNQTTGSHSIKFATKSELVFESLRDQIVGGELQPGEIIDQERIAAALDVSRMPLRLALSKLAEAGLIELRPHRSAVVASMSTQAIDEIYAMRAALESMLVEVAVDKLTAQDHEHLAELNEQIRHAVQASDTAGFVSIDRELHLTLYCASGFTTAVAEVERLRDGSDRYVGAYAALPTLALRSVDEHSAILDACRSGDGSEAARLVRNHVQEGARVLREKLREQATTDHDRA